MKKLQKTAEEWQQQLSPEEYYITRQKGTEPAFSGRYWNSKTKGIYRCRCCGEALFSSTAKYDSGCGWPSFYQPIDAQHIEQQLDLSYGMRRIEVMCRHCDAHLGHVFDDGPLPTKQRYCINSAALQLEPEDHSHNSHTDV